MFRDDNHCSRRINICTLLLPVFFVIGTSYSPAWTEEIYDLVVESIEIDDMKVSFDAEGYVVDNYISDPCTLTVTIGKLGSAPLPGDQYLHCVIDDLEIDSVQVTDDTLSTYQFIVYGPMNDGMCWVDYGEDEYYENNNSLRVTVQDGCLSALTVPDPDGSGTMDLEFQSNIGTKKTHNYPFALLILPPYTTTTATPGGTMATTLTLSQSHGQVDEYITGVSAGIAIETSFSFCGIGSSAGASVETQWEEATGYESERTESDSYNATCFAGAEESADHMALLTSTTYYLCDYDVTSGSEDGQRVILAVVRQDDPIQNPKILPCPLKHYDELAWVDALNLKAGCTIGNADSYDSEPNASDHVDGNSISANTMIESGRTVGIGGQHWAVTLSENNYTTQHFDVTFAAKGAIGGVEFSAGTMNGETHSIIEGRSSEYDFQISGTNSVAEIYDAVGYVSNVTVQHDGNGTPRTDGFLLVDYYVHGASGGSGEDYEKEAVGAVQEVLEQIPDPQEPGEIQEIIDVLTGLISEPGNPVDWWAALAAILQDIYNYLYQYLYPDPYQEAVNEALALCQVLIDAVTVIVDNPPDEPDWSLSVTEVVSDLNALAYILEWVMNPDPVVTDPDLPVAGGELVIYYDDAKGMHPDLSGVEMRLSVNGIEQNQFAMVIDSLRGVWSAVVTLPDEAEFVDFIFDLLGNVDDHWGEGWQLPVTGHTILDHDNGNVLLSASCQGILGFIDEVGSEGNGFQYPVGGNNWLHIGGLWVGNHEFVNNRDYSADPTTDWQSADQSPWGIYRTGSNGIQFTHSVYNDAGGSGRGLVVFQGGVSREANPDDDFVIMNYHLWNCSEVPLENLHIGQFADFNMGASGELDQGGIDAVNELVYMHDGNSSPYVGVCPLTSLNPDLVTSLCLIDLTIHSVDNYIPDEDKYNYMANHPAPPAEAGNAAALAALGPFEMAPGEVINVAFAILAGDNLTDLQNNGARAREWWSARPHEGYAAVPSQSRLNDGILLRQNTPNPFNPLTTIVFDLPKRAAVNLSVYDTSGRLVCELINNHEINAGRREIAWNGHDSQGHQMASGTYFYRLEVKGHSETKRMILLR